MKYLDDIWALIQLKDIAYKKLANDSDALRRLIKYFIVVSYILVTILGLVVSVIVSIFFLATGKSILVVLLTALLVILILPWFGLLINIFFAWLNHIVAVLLGGKARSFWDFYKVYQYPRPAVMVVSIIPIVNMIAQVYAIWDFAVLYKCLLNIHKLEKKTAIWFIAIKAGLSLISRYPPT